MAVALSKTIETGEGSFFQELLNHLENTIAALDGIARKAREIPALQQLHMIVSVCNFETPISDKYDYICFQNVYGLIRLLDERKISAQRAHITIDTEEAFSYTRRVTQEGAAVSLPSDRNEPPSSRENRIAPIRVSSYTPRR